MDGVGNHWGWNFGGEVFANHPNGLTGDLAEGRGGLQKPANQIASGGTFPMYFLTYSHLPNSRFPTQKAPP